jgi:predicted amidophosphoribosyltransferase
MPIGGMSDEVIPEFDPPPRSGRWHTTAAEYCYDNGHTGDTACVVCGEKLTPIRPCDACGQAYVISKLGDTGICMSCDYAENGLRNMIADEVRLIMDDYREAVLNQIRQSLTLKTRRDNPQP